MRDVVDVEQCAMMVRQTAEEDEAISITPAEESRFKCEQLYDATVANELKKVEQLIKEVADEGGNINWQHPMFGKGKDTALIAATANSRTDIMRMLIESGANVDTQNESGVTALMKACIHGFASLAEMLVEAGADQNLQTKYGDTAQSLAEKNGHSLLINLFQKTGSISPPVVTQSITITTTTAEDPPPSPLRGKLSPSQANQMTHFRNMPTDNSGAPVSAQTGN